MSEEDTELRRLRGKVRHLEEELLNTKKVLGTLISWLGLDIGDCGVKQLLDMLNVHK